jgi:hypothetical protein
MNKADKQDHQPRKLTFWMTALLAFAKTPFTPFRSTARLVAQLS